VNRQAIDPDAILADLNEEQREAATAVSGPVMILAGAGTGKTRVISHRVAYAVAIGAVDEKPYRVSGAQAEGCSPVARAFADGSDDVSPVKPDTIARSLAIGAPADGSYALQVARSTGGEIDACTEDEIVDGIRLLAETEGVFTETAGGVTIAVLKRMVERGVVAPDDETVAYVTGNGYKTIDALEGRIEASFHVRPDLDGFLEALERHLA